MAGQMAIQIAKQRKWFTKPEPSTSTWPPPPSSQSKRSPASAESDSETTSPKPAKAPPALPRRSSSEQICSMAAVTPKFKSPPPKAAQGVEAPPLEHLIARAPLRFPSIGDAPTRPRSSTPSAGFDAMRSQSMVDRRSSPVTQRKARGCIGKVCYVLSVHFAISAHKNTRCTTDARDCGDYTRYGGKVDSHDSGRSSNKITKVARCSIKGKTWRVSIVILLTLVNCRTPAMFIARLSYRDVLLHPSLRVEGLAPGTRLMANSRARASASMLVCHSVS